MVTNKFELQEIYWDRDNYKEVFRKINENFLVLRDLSLTLQSARIRENFTVSTDTKSKFILLSGRYMTGTNTLEVYLNGNRTFNFTESSNDSFTLNPPAVKGDRIIVLYQGYSKTSTGAIDKLLSEHDEMNKKYDEIIEMTESLENSVIEDYRNLLLKNVSIMNQITDIKDQANDAVTDSSSALREIRELYVAVAAWMNQHK